jgi:hypothetical protein
MAISILRGSERHGFKHDLESFFWVLYYLLALPTDLEQDEVYRTEARADLNGMLIGGYYMVANSKGGIVSRGKLWINPIYSVIAERMEELNRLFYTENHRCRGKDPERLKLYPELTYESVLDVLDKALKDLAGGGDVSRVPPLRLEGFESKRSFDSSSEVTDTSFISSAPSASAHSSNSGRSSSGGRSKQCCGEKRGREDDPVSNVKRPKMEGKD